MQRIMKNPIVIWSVKIIAVIILLQTLYFKFSAAPESVYIFTKLGAEPFGRIGSGVIELIASILILVPRTSFYGAVLGFCTMAGAVLSHIFVLGIIIQNDGGELFLLAIITLVCCLILIYMQKEKILNGLLQKI